MSCGIFEPLPTYSNDIFSILDLRAKASETAYAAFLTSPSHGGQTTSPQIIIQRGNDIELQTFASEDIAAWPNPGHSESLVWEAVLRLKTQKVLR